MRRSTNSVGRRSTGAALLVLLVFQAGCGAGWHSVNAATTDGFTPSQQVRVWSGGAVTRLHSFRTSADSVSGVPWLQPADCEFCRVSFAVASVDSVQAGRPEHGFVRGAGISLLVMMGALAWCYSHCPTS